MLDDGPKYSFQSLLLEAADTLGMELQRSNGTLGSITGGASRRVDLMAGLNWEIFPKVVDSATYKSQGKVGLLVHVCGALWMVILVGQPHGSLKTEVWLLDGSKLNWSVTSPVMLFPPSWDRAQFYRSIMKGTVAGFVRDGVGGAWEKIPAAMAVMLNYVANKQSVSDRYRTVGPRGV